jgi:hypothetical protein
MSEATTTSDSEIRPFRIDIPQASEDMAEVFRRV